MTTLQMAMIKKIAENDYTATNGRKPETLDDIGEVWANCVIEDAQDKGVFTTLLSANLVTHRTYKNKSDNSVSLTQKGLNIYLQS